MPKYELDLCNHWYILATKDLGTEGLVVKASSVPQEPHDLEKVT